MIPEIHDINPRTWLRPFQRTSPFYLLKMGLFYHGLGMVLMYAGSFLATNVITDYEIPQFPVSIALALSSGLLEESVFFGIPYYMTAGNPIILLGTGMIWSASHLFSSGTFSVETLAYGGFLLTIPHIFFSIRAWISKKGWFAILFHSGWNVSILILYCMIGLRQCSVANDMLDVLNVIMAASAGMIVYLAYQNKKKNYVNRFLYLVPAIVIIIIATVILLSNGDAVVF
ncbi:type II CAAX prenyl endopeptidase Rce1 family protein [Nitrosopumilus sp.]|uniref:type II CAAX prenyl endopeptidase Rce1 family protein n=1 Tax=Nitrosopumilus sp. TaxID=2024843 RepID=UPI00292E87CF|nr:CPBP family glutamic-type intramembrane protease [Nitrosopumilus sp.]